MALPPVTFPTLGWQVIDWIEEYLVHGPGDIQGDPIEIDDEIALHICWLFRLFPRDHELAGRRMVRRGILSRPKGRAKSEIAGSIVCALALGPVVCDGWDANGDPVGRPVTYPFLRCLATEEEQAGNTYDNVNYMLTEGRAANEYALDVGLTRTFIREPGGGEIVPSSSGNASKDGGKETGSVADETHLYITPALRSMYRTVARNTGKRKDAEALMYETTTAYAPGERSIAEQAADQYGAMPLEETLLRHGILYDHRQADEPKRFGDDRSLIKALRTGYGPAADWMDFRRIVQLIREAEDPEGEAYRYWLNIPRKGASRWLAPDEIAAVIGEVRPEPGAPITLGFDGSENDDHTALMGCTEPGDVFTIGVWTPSGADLGWRQEVDDAVAWAMGEFNVVRMYGDPPWWQEEMVRWAAAYGSPPVAEFWTNIETKMAVSCGALRTAIRRQDPDAPRFVLDPRPLRTPPLVVLNDEIHGDGRAGKPLVQWHFENAHTRKVRVRLEDRAEEAYIVRKDRPNSPRKIDSVTSAVLARRARDDGKKAGEFDEPDYGFASW